MGIQDDKSPDSRATHKHAEITELLNNPNHQQEDQLPQSYEAHGEQPPDRAPAKQTSAKTQRS